MKRCLLVAGLAALGLCRPMPPAQAQDQAPAPPIAQPGAAQPGAAPTTTAPGTPGAGVAALAPPVPLPGVRTVMVFPFESAATPPMGSMVDLRALGASVAEGVRKGLEASRIFSTVMYSPDSVLVQRARDENPREIGPAIANVINPTTGAIDQNSAMKIAARTSMQGLMLGSIEEYTYDKATNKVTVVGSATILNPITGEPLRNAAVSGSATGSAGQDEVTVAQAAANDLVQRLLAGLSVPPPPSLTSQKPRRQPHHKSTQEEEGSRHHIPGWIPAGVILGILFATAI
jgi:hypothetical protein